MTHIEDQTEHDQQGRGPFLELHGCGGEKGPDLHGFEALADGTGKSVYRFGGFMRTVDAPAIPCVDRVGRDDAGLTPIMRNPPAWGRQRASCAA